MEVEEATRSDLSCLIAMKHVCKFCHKRFPCGRSLGGHMRSHLITNPSDHETPPKEKVKKKKKNQLTPPPTVADAAAGDPNPIKCCKECGKGFDSSKALSGHMKSHSVEREKEKQREKENSSLGDDQIENEKFPKQQVMDRESDNGAAGTGAGAGAGVASNCRRPRRSNRRQRYMGAITTSTNTNGGSSSVSEIDKQEQEEVAMGLIMLSRDVGPWGGLSDNNSVFLEPKSGTGVADEAGEDRGLRLFNWVGTGNGCRDSNCDGSSPDKFLSNLGKIESVLVQPEFVSAAMSEIETSKRKTKFEALEEGEKRSKFECTTCNKTFHSYQALGGHRASHKKAKCCTPSKTEGAQMGDSDEITAISAPKRGGQMVQKHECPICFKEFPSGQALGGHKRSHLMAASLEATKFVSVVEKSNATTLTATTTTTTTTSSHQVRDFLDLNLPAPVEEEASNGPHHHQQQLDLVGFKPWWVESTHKHEQLVGLI